jgi:XTP/dITP diphosphohydrolase
MKLIMATHNQKKLREMMRILAPLAVTVETADLPEVEEDGTTFAANAYLKAKSACDATGLPAVADDSGLVIDALNGAPGIFSARYGGEGLTDEDRVKLVLTEMEGVPPEQRSARFVCAICCVFPDGTILRAEDTCEGMIGTTPIGENGFGYDPIFMRGDRSLAQYTDEEKDAVSHRGKALRQFFTQLAAYHGKEANSL